jgi:succinate dehydrogenase flavin-adding protein (antitoxin of CptAB toxin-antitoxin module)
MRGKALKENDYIVINFNYSHTSSSKDKKQSCYTGMLTSIDINGGR